MREKEVDERTKGGRRGENGGTGRRGVQGVERGNRTGLIADAHGYKLNVTMYQILNSERAQRL